MSQEALGKPIRLSPRQLEEILDPYHFVKVRNILGGPAPGVVRKSIERHRKRLGRHSIWLAEKQKLLRNYSLHLKTL